MDTTFLERWLFDPAVGKIVATILLMVVIRAGFGFLERSVTLQVRDSGTRYRLRKVLEYSGYLAMVILITVVFSDRLGNLTVAFGVAGAGIAFALQEVIVSIAGWFAITFAGFYNIGDRVQLLQNRR
jgi:small-conductance mechanosensitive channel